ncbi:MAG: pseudaminic acid synthase [Oligoflexia bacterium]|nr:pseudaminic acid synthase [Oligoflexia bacterium]
MMDIQLGRNTVGAKHRPFIIAEMSGNHNQSLTKALEIVDAAAKTGVQALKIQTYTADTITLNVKKGEFVINDPKSLWNGRSLHDLYNEAHTPWEWHKPIFDRCRELGIIGFSTPFDPTSVDFLESLNVPFYKIASFELVDIPLIRLVAKTKKPMIMSTGMATIDEIKEAVSAAREEGCREIVVLKCTSTYPATPQNSNILTIPDMRKILGTQVGLSDHTMGVGVSVAAVSHGATVIEKHFTLKRSDGGVDSAFSLEPHELQSLVLETERAWQSLGSVSYGPTEAEKPSLQFRRSLYIAESMKAGEVLTAKNIRSVRPGLGLAPKHLPELLGKKIKKDVEKGTPMSWDLV